ncbi:hypothetical protein CWM58_23930 [Klebsiella sp. H-Nf2]|nr:hypothetical protein CWM58_23930 [Klebsiella sp. H-Nf2]PJX44078.1 hypothetical protein CWM62_05460 [Klebsiella sp. C-Nf10]PJX52959.1 hypothetical protein CWM54_15345 [Klebsiella sp. D-Nf1]
MGKFDIVILLIHSIIAEQKPRNKVADPACCIFPIRAVILRHQTRYYKLTLKPFQPLRWHLPIIRLTE